MELARFRNDWKNEVLNKTSDKIGDDVKNQAKNIAIYHEFPDRKRIDSVEPVAEEKIDDNEFTYEQPENREEKAKYLFNKGVLLEQQNRHYEGFFKSFSKN